MKIINICGFPRSGTTFLASLLHSKVGFYALPECQFRFPDSFFNNDNLFDRFRHSRRVKKSYFSWDELTDNNLTYLFASKYHYKPLTDFHQFQHLSIEFCNRYYTNFSAEFLIDHTPENLFGFDDTTDYSNQYFIFIRRSLTDIVKSHRSVSWSNQPLSLLTSRYCIYNSYINYLCDYLDSSGLSDQYLNVTYSELLSKNINTIVYESGIKSFFSDALLSDNKPQNSPTDFPLPRYTRQQHSHIGHNISELKLLSESQNKSLYFDQMRTAYHSLTFTEILRSFLFR